MLRTWLEWWRLSGSEMLRPVWCDEVWSCLEAQRSVFQVNWYSHIPVWTSWWSILETRTRTASPHWSLRTSQVHLWTASSDHTSPGNTQLTVTLKHHQMCYSGIPLSVHTGAAEAENYIWHCITFTLMQIIVTPTFMSQQDFPVVGQAGTHFQLFCIRMPLKTVFIVGESVASFLSRSIDCWLCQNLKIMRNVVTMSPQWRLHHVCLFQPTVQSCTWSQTHSCHSEEKQQTCT